MIKSSSSFIVSSIPLYHNAVKSIIFKVAELLMALFIYKLFSLIAARSKLFTSYLMFAEDYIQRLYFISSRGLSRAGFIVLAFSLLNILASLFGTLLWALDSPGYIFRASDATVADYSGDRNENSPYVIQLYLDPTRLQDTNQTIAQTMGSDLFNSGVNITMTGEVSVRGGTPEITKPTRSSGIGPRIWLDNDGFSVSIDTLAMYPTNLTIEDGDFPNSCIRFGGGSASWNCTFSNVFSQGFVETVTGRPEVHWDDRSDGKYNSRYVRPNRVDNIWTSFGAGAGSTAMMQVFTITKGTRRHTFAQFSLKATMLTTPDVPFAEKEVKDLIQRTWSSNETQRTDPLISQITNGMMNAQNKGMSYQFGAGAANNNNLTVLQSNWGLFTLRSNGKNLLSLISITTTNITLIRSENIANAPTPFEKCDRSSFQNEAFGGKVSSTDCAGSIIEEGPKFFGQVDTAAVLIMYGLGKRRSNISSASLDDDVLTWTWSMEERIKSLLVARGYAVSVDPSLVAISVDTLMVAMSGLQLFLSGLALVLAVIAWLSLSFFAKAYWSNSFLSNIVHTAPGLAREANPGYMHHPPEISLSADVARRFIAISGRIVGLYDPTIAPMQPIVPQAPGYNMPNQYIQPGPPTMGSYEAVPGREEYLSAYQQGYSKDNS